MKVNMVKVSFFTLKGSIFACNYHTFVWFTMKNNIFTIIIKPSLAFILFDNLIKIIVDPNTLHFEKKVQCFNN